MILENPYIINRFKKLSNIVKKLYYRKILYILCNYLFKPMVEQFLKAS